MSNIMVFEDKTTIDLDTIDGVYEHIARFLRKNGADSDIFASLNRLKTWMDIVPESIKDEKFVDIKTIEERFKSIVDGEGLLVPRLAVKAAIKQLKTL